MASCIEDNGEFLSWSSYEYFSVVLKLRNKWIKYIMVIIELYLVIRGEPTFFDGVLFIVSMNFHSNLMKSTTEYRLGIGIVHRNEGK
jgi:hypothetical protein